jgi:hypothetical protein
MISPDNGLGTPVAMAVVPTLVGINTRVNT